MSSQHEDDLRSHRECIRALTAFEACLDAPPAAPEWPTKAGDCLQRFTCALRTHFAGEERGHLYTELPVQKPRLADRIEALRSQHVEILETCDAMCNGIGDVTSDDHRAAFASRARRLVETIRKHEADETALMQSAHLREVGAGD